MMVVFGAKSFKKMLKQSEEGNEKPMSSLRNKEIIT